jgi:hypothetical protein
MQSIRGIYTGKEIKPLEDISARPNVRVIITFLDDVVGDSDQTQGAKTEHMKHDKTPTQLFLEKCGGWEDSRSPDDIIDEIYASRTTSERGVGVFQENAS